MQYQNLFSGKKEKYFQMSSAEFLPSTPSNTANRTPDKMLEMLVKQK